MSGCIRHAPVASICSGVAWRREGDFNMRPIARRGGFVPSAYSTSVHLIATHEYHLVRVPPVAGAGVDHFPALSKRLSGLVGCATGDILGAEAQIIAAIGKRRAVWRGGVPCAGWSGGWENVYDRLRSCSEWQG